MSSTDVGDLDTDVGTEPAGGWIEAQTVDAVSPAAAVTPGTPCNEQGRRHSYKGSTVCLKCGTPKPVHVPRSERSSESSAVAVASERTPRSGGADIKTFRGALSLTWMALGIGLESSPLYPDISQPVGRVLQFQAPIAGVRITNALKKTPAWKPILAMMRAVGPWADLAPLIAPPLLVGLMARFPELQQRLMPMAVGMLLPIIAETSTMAEEQAQLMSDMQKYNQEAVGEALGILGGIFSTSEDNVQSPNGVHS